MPVFYINQAKLDLYLLNPDHAKGRAKSTLFLRYGFSRAALSDLANALTTHAQQGRATSSIIKDRYATKRVVRGPLRTPSGRTPHAVSVWELMTDGRERLVTAYIREV